MVNWKCECCENTTKTKLEDFDENGWIAFKIGNNKTKAFCPTHYLEGRKQMEYDLLINSVKIQTFKPKEEK